MKNVRALVICGLSLALAASCGGRGGTTERLAHSDARMWVPFDDGMAVAAKEHKHVVIDFYTSWCRWCKVMDRETFSEPEVKQYLAENFVTIRINAEDATQKLTYKGGVYTPVTLGRLFGVRGYPSLAYLDRNGELVTVIPGFVPAKTFLPLLRYMHQECYRQRMTFEEFMRRKGNCDTTAAL